MNKDELSQLLEDSINELIGGNVGFEKKIGELLKKHEKKTHFIPIKYRVLGGFLQSLNIKFGNFIEILLPKIINSEDLGNYETVKDVSGKKDITLELEEDCERAIDNYVNHPKDYSEQEFDKLLSIIFKNQNNDSLNFNSEVFDIDLMLKKNSGEYIYVEIKYNDDHDTGKFSDINRKFLKTFAGLVRKYGIKDKTKVSPILYYFNQHRRYKNKYLKEHEMIMRSKELFERLELKITFEEISDLLFKISENLEEDFDELKDKIFNKVKNKDKEVI